MRAISGYEGHYALSQAGSQVISLKHTVKNERGQKRTYRQRILRPVHLKGIEPVYRLRKEGCVEELTISEIKDRVKNG